MRTVLRVLSVATVVAVVGAGCGSDRDDAAPGDSAASVPSSSDAAPGVTAASVPSSSDAAPGVTYVVVAGDSLSAIASRHGVTLDDMIAANGWADGADHLIRPGDAIALPGGATAPPPTAATAAPTTRPAQTATTAAAAGSPTSAPATTAAGPTGGYEVLGTFYAGPDFVNVSPPLTDPPADGVYESDVRLSGGTVVFDLYSLARGDACVELAGTNALDCEDDGGFPLPGSATVALDPSVSAVTLIFTPAGLAEAVRVDADELVRLLGGAAPAADAPSGFTFGSYWPFVVTVRDGVAVAADQHFVS